MTKQDGWTRPATITGLEFELKEFELLRGEIEARSKDQRDMERNLVILLAAVVSFLVTKEPSQPAQPGQISTVVTVGWLLPPFVSFLALGRWLESLRTIRVLAEYLRKREVATMTEGGGWETFLEDIGREKCGLPYVSAASTWFWLLMTGLPTMLAWQHTILEAGTTTIIWIQSAAIGALIGGVAWLIIESAKLNQSPSPALRVGP